MDSSKALGGKDVGSFELLGFLQSEEDISFPFFNSIFYTCFSKFNNLSVSISKSNNI